VKSQTIGNGKSTHLPFGYLTVRHGKSPCLIGKPSINGQFSMAMLVITRGYLVDFPLKNYSGNSQRAMFESFELWGIFGKTQ